MNEQNPSPWKRGNDRITVVKGNTFFFNQKKILITSKDFPNTSSLLEPKLHRKYYPEINFDNKGNIRTLKKNKKSFVAHKIAEVILDKLLLDDRNIH